MREHQFLLAPRRWGRFTFHEEVPLRETSQVANSEEKRMFSQATFKTNLHEIVQHSFSIVLFQHHKESAPDDAPP